MKKYLKQLKNKIFHRQRMRNLDQKMLSISIPLRSEMLSNCKVFADRNEMLKSFPKNGTVAEVGVATGAFSAAILEITQPDRLYLIDAWAMDKHPDYGPEGYQKVTRKFAKDIHSGRVHMLRGWSWKKLNELEPHSLDWIYIDAAHDYESVKKDLNTAIKKVKAGGIISGHDYTRWAKNGKRFGVLEAVNEFSVNNRVEFFGISLENNYNWSYALKIQ